MNKEKLNLKNIKNVLSRDEMKKIVGGGNPKPCEGAICSSSPCGSGCTCKVITFGDGSGDSYCF